MFLKTKKGMNYKRTQHIEDLVEMGSFYELDHAQQQLVLQEMTAEEFDAVRKIMMASSPLLSIDKFDVEPRQDTRVLLQKRWNGKTGQIIGLPRLYFYASSIAAALIFGIFMYTLFFKEDPLSGEYIAVKLVQETIETKQMENDLKESTSPNEQLAEVKHTDNKQSFISNKQQKSSPIENAEELKFLGSEMLFFETNEDVHLALLSGEDERDFHYYTRLGE